MNSLKMSAGLVALVDSVLGLYFSSFGSFKSSMGGFQQGLLWVSAFLLVDSLLCVYGVRYAFPVAAVLSAAVVADALLLFPAFDYQELAVLTLSLIALALSLLAFRSTSQLSEQANPMNLPVFG